MAFWGVEVKPGKPFVHKPRPNGKRLHISLATLGAGVGGGDGKGSVVQCNVGEKSRPVYLCSLSPGAETCQIHLEFHELSDVVFSVLGPRSVHLSGYYLPSHSHSPHCDDDDHTESFGEDIAESESRRSAGEEGGDGGSDQDRYEDSFIDDEDDPHANADDDAYTNSNSAADDDFIEDTPEKKKKKPKNAKPGGRRRLKRKCQISESDDVDSVSPTKDNHDNDSVSPAKDNHDNDSVSPAKDNHDNDSVSPTKDNHDNDSVSPAEDNHDNDFVSPTKDNHDNDSVSTKNGVSSSTSIVAVPDTESEDNLPISLLRKREPPAKIKVPEAVPEAEPEAEAETKAAGNQTSEISQPKADEDDHWVSVSKRKADAVDAQGEGIMDHCVVESPVESISERRKKTKKRKTQENDDTLNAQQSLQATNTENGSAVDIVDSSAANKSNELVIEDLETGKSDGMAAAPGKRVHVHYVGKLLESKHVFDSNVDGAPFKFRLGGKKKVQQFWNVGIDGMRVGGKRRLVVPPSMGYGSEGDGKSVPPNSWLVYEVELIKVK